MNLYKALTLEYGSAENLRNGQQKIIRYIGNDKNRFDELMDLFLTSVYRINQRASGPVNYFAETRPQWIKPFIPKLLKNLQQDGVHPSQVRNTIRMLQYVEIPARYSGAVADLCLSYLSDPKTAIAIRVFSMTVLSNIAEKYPDFKNEIRVIIEQQLPHASPAIKSRLKRIKL